MLPLNLILTLHACYHAFAALLKHVVGERDLHIAVFSFGKTAEEVLDCFCLVTAFVVLENGQELVEFDAARPVVVNEVNQSLDLFDVVHEAEPNQRFLHLLDPDGARAVVVKTREALLERLELAERVSYSNLLVGEVEELLLATVLHPLPALAVLDLLYAIEHLLLLLSSVRQVRLC